MPRRTTGFLATGVVLAVLGAFPAFAAETDPSSPAPLTKAQRDFFEAKIRPVLIERCHACHSARAEKPKADFLLDTRAGIRRGGASGRDAVVPGNVEGSQLIEAIRYTNEKLRMPPEEKGGRLPDAVIADFEAWVAMGAPDPRDGTSKLPREIEAETHWSFQPLSRAEPPAVRDADWPRDRLDFFVKARLEAEGLAVAGDADRRTLIRRATLLLTGLPPRPEAIADFLADPAPDREAFARVVDRLLDSPDFGPRWGRHWLDVARFAESSGYSRNMLYPHAWRYRNWVIEAHNRDLPYDDFVRAQIAGDLLPFDSPEQRDEQVTATAFLTIGPKTLNEGVPLLFHLNVADDQIDATCRAFLGLTANCARCHDHKYDPIPTRDYHAMAGIFLSSRNLAGTSTNVRAEHEEAHPLGKDGAALLERIAELTKKADDTRAAYLEVVKKRDELREPLEKMGVDWKKNPTPELAAAEAEVRAFQEKVKAAREAIPAPPEFTMAVLDAPAMEDAAFEAAVKKAADEKKPAPVRLADSPIYEKGLHDKPLAPVPRGVLTLLEKHVASPKVPAAESGRRQLAAWLTDPANPLTARVYVNRVWRHLFGAGIVETTDNFGLLGAKPSHPELLDDLARRFMDEGWSTKELIRSIVLSRTWMLDSTAIAASEAADPGNRWLWRFRPRRLEGEVIRDSLLFVGGTLDPSPLEGSQVAEIAKQQPKALQREIGRRDYYTKDATADVAHRSVYLPAARSALFDVMTIWDAPDPNLVVGERRLTTVPPQALFMMNSPLVIEQSRKAAESLLARMDTARADEKLTAASEAVLGRPPEPGERESLSAFLEGEDGAETDRWSRLFQALMATGEFRTVY